MFNIVFTEDELLRREIIDNLNVIKLSKKNIKELKSKDILFIETSNEGDTYFFTRNKKLYFINYFYGKELNKDEIMNEYPEFGEASYENQKDFIGINLGLGHALLIRTENYDEYMKILTSETLYEDQYEHCYNAYNHWMNCAIIFIDRNNKK